MTKNELCCVYTHHAGDLCGTCEDGYGVTMDLQSCISANCATGLALFLLCCKLHFVCIFFLFLPQYLFIPPFQGILIVTFSLAVLYFNILLPNGLKGFFFYAQVYYNMHNIIYSTGV